MDDQDVADAVPAHQVADLHQAGVRGHRHGHRRHHFVHPLGHADLPSRGVAYPAADGICLPGRVRTVLLGEEALELGAELLGGGHVLRLGEQVVALGGAGERVVLLLQGPDDLLDLVVAVHLLGDVGVGGGGRLPEPLDGQHEPGDGDDRVEGGDGGGRVGGLGQVVRDVDGEPDGVVAASPSRSSSSPAALPGTWTLSNQELRVISSGRVACAVVPTGRVCGTPIGMPWKPTTSPTPSRFTRCRTDAVKPSHSRSGSGPDSIRNGLPTSSWSSRTTSSGAS